MARGEFMRFFWHNDVDELEREAAAFDADRIIADADAELYNSTESVYSEIDYYSSAQIALAIDWN
jgi:hypothetical protein